MKSKEQVIRYTSRRAYPALDWLRVLEVCHKFYGSGVKKASHPKSESNFDEFVDWLKNGIGDGDVVSVDGKTGIFCNNGDGTFKLLAWKSDNDEIYVEDVKINSSECVVVDGNDFYRSLRRSGYQYFLSLGTVSKRKLPHANQVVKVRYKNKCGIGIISKSGIKSTSFICLYFDDLLRDVSYDTSELDFFSVDKKDNVCLCNILNDNHLKFDKKKSSLVWARKRVKTSGSYWFISDTFTLKTATDKRAVVDNWRYEIGNYFSEYKIALDFLKELIEKRKGQE